MKQVFTKEEADYISAVGMKLIAGEEITDEERRKVRELSERLEAEQRKEAMCGKK